MILFGIRDLVYNPTPVEGKSCPKCGKNALEVHVKHKILSLFFIPTFPSEKVSFIKCAECDFLEYPRGIKGGGNFANEVKAVAITKKPPVWSFVGAVLIAGLIGFIIFQNIQDGKNSERYIANPAVNDRYEIKLEDKRYTTFLLYRVSPDSVFFYMNNLEVSSSVKLSDDEFVKPAFFNKTLTVSYGRNQLAGLLKEGFIEEVRREK